MKKIAAAPLASAEEPISPAHSDSFEQKDAILLTPPEAATYLRASKSYLDKLRVYGGGP